MTGLASTVQIRRSDDHVDVIALNDVRLRQFDTAVPWREFRWYRKQRHFSGSYWSATMEAPVGYESRLEYVNLLLADFDPRVVWILSQPFLLDGDDRGTRRKHVPDYLFVHADESGCVVDVKPAEKLSRPKVRFSGMVAARDRGARLGVPGAIRARSCRAGERAVPRRV